MDRDEAVKLLRSGPQGIAEWNQLMQTGGIGPPVYRPPHGAWEHIGHVDLTSSDLSGLVANGVHLEFANLSYVKLAKAQLSRATLDYADLSEANLNEADLTGASLTNCILSGTNLRDAELEGASLADADLQGADLRGAYLTNANLTGAALGRARLEGATFGGTVLACDLSRAFGVDRVDHHSSSVMNVNSLVASRDALPDDFLRGCGLRDEEVTYFRSVVGRPIRFYSCFISYSSPDEDFASRLHTDFQVKGIRCWKWDHHARTGRSIWGEIDQAIRVYNKVVLIASESSLKSPAVNREIERAIQEEDRRLRQSGGNRDADTDVLFPVRLDDYVFQGGSTSARPTL